MREVAPKMKTKSTVQTLTKLLLEDAPQNKKAEFLTTYLRLVVREGITAATLTRIAKEHKTSKAHVHYYLPDFDETCLELFKLVARHGQQMTKNLLEQERDPKGRLQAVLRAPFVWAFSSLDMVQFLIAMFQKSGVDKKLRALHQNHLEVGRDRVALILSEALGLKGAELTKKAHLIHSQFIATLILMQSNADFNKDSIYLSNYEYFIEQTLSIKFKVFP